MATASAVKETETTSGQKPVKTFRRRGVSASIFANQAKSDGREFTFYKASFERSYKDGDEVKYTASFGRNDLPLLKKVVDEAWDFILDTEASRGKGEDAE